MTSENRDLDKTRANSPARRRVSPSNIGREAGSTQDDLSIEISAHYSEMFTGPLPPPAILIRYNEAHPDAADRIITMAEKQQEHRQTLEKAAVLGNIKSRREGMYLGFVLGLVIVLGGIYLLSIGRALEGYTALIGAAGIFVITFVYGRARAEKERIEKAKIMAGNKPALEEGTNTQRGKSK